MAGFQLSFGAVFGLLTLGTHIKRLLLKALPLRLSDMISASVGATAGTVPVLAASFNRLSILSIVINIVVLPLASLAIVLTFLTTLLALLIGQTASHLAFAADAVIRLMLTIIEALAVISFAAVNVAAPPWYITIGFFLMLFIVSKYLLVSTRIKAIVGGALMAAVLLMVLITQPAGMTVTFLDVGQGDAAFVRTVQGGEYFVDGGPPKSADEVVDFTVRRGITPDAAFVSHTDDDHFAGLVALYEHSMLHKVYCSVQEYETVKAAMPKAEVVPLSAGDAVLLDDETRAVVLYPYSDSAAENKNDLSLVLLIEYKGHSALLTGDISGENETALFAGLSNVDIYKAAHHGSKYASYRLPLSVLNPRYSIVSVGENSFGHPHAWALNNLGDYSDAVYTTLQDHAVVFSIDDTITVNTYGG
jgi:competence protein ComEC